MEIELWNGSAKAVVDPLGAWMTNLSDDNGDIFYPKRALKTADGSRKDRGGLFVCAPNFGPGGSSELPQHGFARTKEWEIIDKTENSVLLKLAPGEGDYQDVSFIVSYQLNDHVLIATLDVVNDTSHDVRIAPAFHPYFATQEGAVKINGREQDLSELHEAVFEENADAQELELAGRTIAIEAQELKTWVKWTDELGPYVCIEPSLAGFSFMNDAPTSEELLKADETKTFTFMMSWR